MAENEWTEPVIYKDPHVGQPEFFNTSLKLESQAKFIRYIENKIVASVSEKLIKPIKIFLKKVYAIG